jgi:peptidoglycan-associated lipoprotein
MQSSRFLPVALLAVAALSACHKKPEVAPTPAPAPIDSTAIKQHIADSLAALARARADSLARVAAEKAREDSIAAAAAQSKMRAALTAMIHFDFNKSDLRSEDQAILDAKIPILLANPNLTLRIAGNTDERGSSEYNLALGQRRAATAKRYLTDHGVADSRLETVSYGEERPLCTDHDEACWSQNRRDEFTITAGGDGMLKPPGN